MKDGEKYLKGNKKCLIVFTIIFLLYICYCICLTPSYILEKRLLYNSAPWTSINAYFKRSILKSLYLWLRYKIPDFTLISCIFDKCRKYGLGFCTLQEKVVVLSDISVKYIMLGFAAGLL